MTKIKLGFLLLICLFLDFHLSAQNFIVQGNFSGNNLERSFINVINTTQYTASISQLDGKFQISAQVGDSILISSIQYKDVKFIVKEKFKTQTLEVPLKLKVTTLDDVDVYSLGLSGDLEKDAKAIRIDESMSLNFGSFDLYNADDPDLTSESEFKMRNLAMEKNQPNLPANFDVLNLALALVQTIFKKKKQNKSFKIENADIQKFTLKDIERLTYYLDIEESEIENFLAYAFKNGLRSELKNTTNEMDLVQFLLELSENYNSKNGK